LALGEAGVIWRAGVSERPETRGRGWERIAAVDVDVGVDQWRESPQVVLGCGVTSSSKFLHGLVEIAGVPQHDCVEDETESSELVLLAFPVSLTEPWLLLGVVSDNVRSLRIAHSLSLSHA
jgi:hypothetical protein